VGRIEGCMGVATCRAMRALRSWLLGMASPPLCSMTSSSCSNANPLDRAPAVCRSCPRLEWSSIKVNRQPSRAVEGNRGQSSAIKCNQVQSSAIKCNQVQSRAIEGNHLLDAL
jgi:hypothetical protein